MICERATELVPRARLAALVGDVVQLDEITKRKAGTVPLLAEVRKFHEASMRGDYDESFAVNSKEPAATWAEARDRILARLQLGLPAHAAAAADKSQSPERLAQRLDSTLVPVQGRRAPCE